MISIMCVQLRLILFLCFIFGQLPALELKRVILSTNDNPNYIQFWPIVAPLWQEIGLTPTLILVAKQNCPIDESLGDVIRFEPLTDISEAFQTQNLRLLLPILFPGEGCLIADIDMLPMSRTYFTEEAKECPSEAFLVYRDKAYGPESKRYPMCYVAAEGQVFSSVFGVTHFGQFASLLRNWAAQGYGWETDEIMMYKYLNFWEELGNQVFKLGHSVGPRLDRSEWDLALKAKDIGKYIDCHCPRPYSAHAAEIDHIVSAIYTQWKLERSLLNP
jgi:hypothetical protein